MSSRWCWTVTSTCRACGDREAATGGGSWRAVAASPQGKAHGIWVGYAVADGFLDGRLYLLGPIAVKQLRQFAGDRAHGVAARCRLGQQFPAGRRGVGEAVGRPVLAGLALVPDQRLDMGGSLDLLALAVAARVFGQHLRAVEDADPRRVGDDGERPPHMGVGDGIVVEVEALGCFLRLAGSRRRVRHQ